MGSGGVIENSGTRHALKDNTDEVTKTAVQQLLKTCWLVTLYPDSGNMQQNIRLGSLRGQLRNKLLNDEILDTARELIKNLREQYDWSRPLDNLIRYPYRPKAFVN